MFKRTPAFKTWELKFIKESQQRASEFSTFLKKSPLSLRQSTYAQGLRKNADRFQYIKAVPRSKLAFGRNSLRYFDSYAKNYHRRFERIVDFVVYCMYNSIISPYFSWWSNPFFVFTFLYPCCYIFLLAAIFCIFVFQYSQ